MVGRCVEEVLVPRPIEVSVYFIEGIFRYGNTLVGIVFECP